MNDLIKAYLEAKNATKSAKEALDSCKDIENSIKDQLRAELENLGMKSAKFESGTVAIAQKPDLAVTNETLAEAWLKETPEIEADRYYKLDKTAFKSVAKEWFKQTGEYVAGTEPVIIEYVQVKEAK